jgi:hypothetical protein
MQLSVVTTEGPAIGAAAQDTGTSTGTSGGDAGSVVVHVQLRPRRGATRRCLAALAALAAAHPAVSWTLTGVSKDDRAVRVTVGVDLGPRAGVARFSEQAQAAYQFVSALFTALYDHMPVYTAEPSETDRAAAAALLDAVSAVAPEAAPAQVATGAVAAVVPTPVPALPVPARVRAAARPQPAPRDPRPRVPSPRRPLPAEDLTRSRPGVREPVPA